MADDTEAVARISSILMDGYVIVDPDRKITAVNPLFLQMVRLRPSDRRKVVETRCCQLLRLDVCSSSHCTAQECMRKNAPIRLNDIRAIGPEDASFVVDISMMPLTDSRESVVGAMILYRDATDERRLKMRASQDANERTTERALLLKVIEDREAEIERLRRQLQEHGAPKT